MKLPVNYRTSQQLLKAAEFLLAGQESQLKATREQGQKLRLVNHFDDNQEAFYLAQTLKQLHMEGTPWDQMAILFRTKGQIPIMETIFEKQQIPTRVVRKNSLRDTPVLLWLHKLLSAAVHPNNLDCILHTFCCTQWGCLKQGKPLLKSFAKFSDSKSFSSQLEAFVGFMTSKYHKHSDYIQLGNSMLSLSKRLMSCSEERPPQFHQWLQLDLFLKPTSASYKKNSELVEEALEEITSFAMNNHFGTPIQMIQAALSQITLEGHFHINGGITPTSSGVPLLTIHAAKGLEFEHVFLSGANSGLIPLASQNRGADHLQEEKRLLFVALTRAKSHMEISWHTQPNGWRAQPSPSYFLNAIPDTLIDRIHNSSPSKEDDTSTMEISELSTTWKKGQRVKHIKYGKGVVLMATTQEIVCEFGKFGKKSFAPSWAPITLV